MSDQPHRLVVTKIADDDVEYTVICPTPQPATCRVWYECTDCPHTPTVAEEDDGEYRAHDVAHAWINDAWMTETDDCALSVTDGDLIGLAEDLGLGTHDIDVDYWGGSIWHATPTNVKEN